MSDFAIWFVSQQLRNMGWPRSKGLFNKVHYVDTTLVDVVVEGVVQIAVGLGAGRPDLGVALLADIYADNPWTTESIDGLIQMLEKGEADIADAPNLFPWKALYKNEHRIAAYAKDIQCQDLGDPTINTVWTLVIAKGVFWGLTHDRDMPEVFTRVKEDYERTARGAIPDGLGVPPQLPWKTLDDFYEYCNEVISAFESTPTLLAGSPSHTDGYTDNCQTPTTLRQERVYCTRPITHYCPNLKALDVSRAFLFHPTDSTNSTISWPSKPCNLGDHQPC